jgi:hypothetical protein
MSNLFQSAGEMKDYIFRITDDGGRSIDRYTVAFTDGSYLALSSSPTHPLGFSQWGEDLDPSGMEERVESGEEIDLALGDLDEALVSHILYRNNEGFRDLMRAAVADDSSWVAKDRDGADENEGLSDSAAVGIYKTEHGYMIKTDDPENDYGPYTTVREAILASLPDHYSFSGPEYHSTVDVASLEPTPGTKEKIAELEAKVLGTVNEPAL